MSFENILRDAFKGLRKLFPTKKTYPKSALADRLRQIRKVMKLDTLESTY